MFKNNNKIMALLFFLISFGSQLFASDRVAEGAFSLPEEEVRPGAGRIHDKYTRDKLLKAIHDVIESRNLLDKASNRPLDRIEVPSSHFKRYTGDWESFEKDIRHRGETTFHILGFGSLLDPNSSNEFSNRREPAIAFGVRRFFGFSHPAPETSALGIPCQPYDDEQLRLTTRVTQKLSDITNGVLLQIDLDSEMRDFRTREKGYDLVRVPILKLKSGHEGRKQYELSMAYILTEPNKACGGLDKTQEVLLPHLAYLYVCLRGASQISHDFLDLFIQTTYLSDEKTPIGNWIDDVMQRHQRAPLSPRQAG